MEKNIYIKIQSNSSLYVQRLSFSLYLNMQGVWYSIGNVTPWTRAAKRIVGPEGKRKLGPSPPILQIMILKLSPPRCVISKESVQQKCIDELWFRKQLSTCLFVWTLNNNDLVHLLNSWAPGRLPGWPPSQWACRELQNSNLFLYISKLGFWLFALNLKYYAKFANHTQQWTTQRM